MKLAADDDAKAAKKPSETPQEAPKETAKETAADTVPDQDTAPDQPDDLRADTPSDLPETPAAPEDGAPETPEPETPEPEMPEPETPERDEPTQAPVEPAFAPTPLPVEQVIIKKGNVGAMALGGMVAGVLGFAAAQFGVLGGEDTQDVQTNARFARIETTLAGQDKALSEMAGTLVNLAQPDPAQQAAMAAFEDHLQQVSARVDSLQTALSDLDQRLSDMVKRPLEGASQAAIAAYERDLQAARTEMAAQRAGIEDMIAQSRSAEDSAKQAASTARKREAIAHVQAALENKQGFAAALDTLRTEGVDIPSALAATARGGVATGQDLVDSFPDAARAALAASRHKAGEDNKGAGNLENFLRRQLGVRSLEPRDGPDPDAVLSRAEAALREGRLDEALAQLDALPEEGRAQLANWATRARERLETLAALRQLSDTENR